MSDMVLVASISYHSSNGDIWLNIKTSVMVVERENFTPWKKHFTNKKNHR